MLSELDIKAAISPALFRRGVVNVIGLDAVRVESGARWEKTKASVYSRIEALFAHRLAPTDFFIRLTETSYLVVMPAATAEEARLCCLRIAFELHRSLLGACTIEDLYVAHVHGESRDGLEMRVLNATEVLELALRGGIRELGGVAPEAAPAERIAPVPARPATAWRYRYTPVWDAHHQAVSAYRLEYEPPLLPHHDDEPSREEVRDGARGLLTGFAQATRQLAAAVRQGGRFILVVPVPYDILGAPAGRIAISSAIRVVDSDLRRLLVFAISNVPPGVPQSRMSDLVCAVRPFCRGVLVEFPPGALDNATCLFAGQQGIGIALPDAHGAGDEIARLAQAGHRAGLLTFVGGIATLAAAEDARNSGVRYLYGPLFGEPGPVPHPMWRLRWKTIAERIRAGHEARPDAYA